VLPKSNCNSVSVLKFVGRFENHRKFHTKAADQDRGVEKLVVDHRATLSASLNSFGKLTYLSRFMGHSVVEYRS
jgi:hypothetical protein